MAKQIAKSMLEKLTEDYEQTLGYGNGGHACGYYRERRTEIVQGKYEFPLGFYTIRCVNGNFFWWDYNPQ